MNDEETALSSQEALSSEQALSSEGAATVCERVRETVRSAVVTDERFLETVLTGILAEGHVLLEDVPGTGKTLTARSLATALGLEFNRIQFTPDLLPADVTGSHVYDESDGSFEFREGPIFANVVLADEINRAPPKTQAALLEAMEEKQVSLEGESRPLPEPFFVIATQNPIDQEGTFPLPEAQRDRFIVKTAMGYPDRDGEFDLLARRLDRDQRTPRIESVIDGAAVGELQAVVETVHVDDKLLEYMIDLCRATRRHESTEIGVSPRGLQRLLEASRARAVLHGRDYVVPDDVERVARPVCTHRIVVTTDAAVRGVAGADVVERVLAETEVPAVVDDSPA